MILLAATALLGAAAPARAAEAPAAPALAIASNAVPTNFKPDGSEEPFYETRLTEIGAEETNGSAITLTDTLPAGLTIVGVEFRLRHEPFEELEGKDYGEDEEVCAKGSAGGRATVTCTIEDEIESGAVIYPGEEIRLAVYVGLPSSNEGEQLQNDVSVQGGGISAPATASARNEVSKHEAPPGFAEFDVSLSGPDGQPVTAAAAHPYQMTTSFALNRKRNSPVAEAQQENQFGPSGGAPKDTPVTLPPGLVGNPTATARCPMQLFNDTGEEDPFPEAETAFRTERNQCPSSTVVGYVTLRWVGGAKLINSIPIYNLAPLAGDAGAAGL